MGQIQTLCGFKLDRRTIGSLLYESLYKEECLIYVPSLGRMEIIHSQKLHINNRAIHITSGHFRTSVI